MATHTLQCATTHEDQWFKRQPKGVNKLRLIIKRDTTSAGIVGEKEITNHSARKQIPANQIMQITEYKNIQSILNNYSSLNELQHSNVSSILSNPTEPQRSLGSAMHFPIHPKQHCLSKHLKEQWSHKHSDKRYRGCPKPGQRKHLRWKNHR